MVCGQGSTRPGDKSLEFEQELKAVAGFLMLKKVWVLKRVNWYLKEMLGIWSRVFKFEEVL